MTKSIMTELYFCLGVSILSLIVSWFLFRQVKKQSVSSEKAEKISQIIRQGANAFLNSEYKVLFVFVVIIAVLLLIYLNMNIAWAFVLGAFLSALAGQIGMKIATASNARTASEFGKDFKSGFNVAFDGGSAIALSVVGLGLLGVTVLYILFKEPTVIYGFGLGASIVALFARLGGGIYTKAADVGADLVGKVEKDIPEDDPRNPAVIADNVGDNVSDVAGMGADLFESFVDSIIAAMVIGSVVALGNRGVLLPLVLAAMCILANMISKIFIKISAKKFDDKAQGGYELANIAQKVLNRGIWVSVILVAIGSYVVIRYLNFSTSIFKVFLLGLIGGLLIGFITERYTSYRYRATRRVAEAARSGAGTNVISGLALGLRSTLLPVIIITIVISFAYKWAQLFGIAIAAVGMVSIIEIILTTDAMGPIADNAAGIAEMAGMGDQIRKRAEDLDAVGNTTAAIGKGFSIGVAALVSLVLMINYGQAVKLPFINLLDIKVIIGLLLGGLIPFVFSACAMEAVGRAAMAIVDEVRRQFRTISGIMTGEAEPDYKKCIDISTKAALRQMIFPGLLGILAPILVGKYLGAAALAGLLGGAIISGFLLAVMMANAGGAWDNAKKFIEAGNLGGKGSDTHKAAVVGDTVGDPFKDTSGPSLSSLIKLMAIIAVIIATLL
ncbi:MAG: sodium-translocating pyrophosphatase [bacterium]